jgi:hypothetical protein
MGTRHHLLTRMCLRDCKDRTHRQSWLVRPDCCGGQVCMMRRPNKKQLPAIIEAAAIANAGIVPYVADTHKCNSCGNKLYHHPVTGYCFICDRDDWQETREWYRPKLPIFAWTAINKVLKQHPEYFTKAGADGQCVTASDQFLFACDEITGNPVNGWNHGVMHKDERGIYLCEHHWAILKHQGNKFCIDLTARQFDEKADCPKIWIDK